MNLIHCIAFRLNFQAVTAHAKSIKITAFTPNPFSMHCFLFLGIIYIYIYIDLFLFKCLYDVGRIDIDWYHPSLHSSPAGKPAIFASSPMVAKCRLVSPCLSTSIPHYKNKQAFKCLSSDAINSLNLCIENHLESLQKPQTSVIFQLHLEFQSRSTLKSRILIAPLGVFA